MLAYYGPEWESLQSRMVDRWCTSFSGNTGSQLPSTMGRNHGVLTNFSNNANNAYVSSPDRLALSFNGVNSYVANVGRSPATENRAVSCWFNFSQTLPSGSFRTIYSAGAGTIGQGLIVTFGTDGNFGNTGFGVTQWGDGIGVTGFNDGVWHHGIAVNIGSLWQIYVDGVFRASKTMATTKVSHPATLGTFNNFSGPSYYSGLIDDIIVFNTAPTANEIQFIYQQDRGGGLLYQPPRRRSYFAAATTNRRRRLICGSNC
jgi:hypothetical protein